MTHHPAQMEEGEVADSKRRGERAVDEHRDDQVLADAVDDTSPDDDLDDDLRDEFDELEGVAPPRAKSNALAGRDRGVTRRAGGANGKSVKADRTASIENERRGVGERIARFVREVVAELRKVNWPSRKELLTYASVVIVFVVIMMTIVGLLDYGFAWVVKNVFAG
jgi:preprotein translocase subunit SecE